MTNTALTGATYDIDGGQLLVADYPKTNGRCCRERSKREEEMRHA